MTAVDARAMQPPQGSTAGRIRADVAQWRISEDRHRAVRAAERAGADLVSLDFGGAHRGPRLDEPRELVIFDRLRADMVIETLAVNHANDLGLFSGTGAINERCLRTVLAAADIAVVSGIRNLHVPSFRASTIHDAGDLAATAAFLRRCARHVGPSMTVLSESALPAADAIALIHAVGEPNVKVVADTGNLSDAGIEPREFVAECSVAGVLAPGIHVKSPALAPPRPLVDDVNDIAWAAEVILLENDYRTDRAGLARDLNTLRRTTSAHADRESPCVPR